MGDKELLIDKIISMEWDMFKEVNKGLEVSDCQKDQQTFNGMRRAQFHVWPPNILCSYLADLENGKTHGRNLLEEKYIHMMRTSEPIEYIMLLTTIEIPEKIVSELANAINKKLMAQTIIMFEKYPYITNMGRPLDASQDNKGNTSIETYQLGELLTYSEKTLSLLINHIEEMENGGISFVEKVLENTIKYWGYNNLTAAEEATRNKHERV